MTTALPRRMLCLLLAGAALLPACSSDSPPPASVQQRFCEKYQACGYGAPNQTVQQCASNIEQCLGFYTSEQLSAWQTKMSQCLGISDCDSFRICYHDIHGC